MIARPPPTSHTYFSFLFFFNDTATTEIYTLSLHDALPISHRGFDPGARERIAPDTVAQRLVHRLRGIEFSARDAGDERARERSEEHTSELQSRLHLVCRLLLEKKKKTQRM